MFGCLCNCQIDSAERNDTRARVPFLLKGLIQSSDGRALTPWFTRKKNGRLYRYYLPVRENKEHAGASGLPRLPAGELEAVVLEQLRRVLRSPAKVAGVTENATRLDPSLDEAQVAVAMTRLESIWNSWLSLLLKGIQKHEIDCQCIIIMNGWRPDRVWYELSARTTTLTVILLTLAMQQFISYYNDYHILSRRIEIDFHGCLLMLGCV